MSKSEKLFVTLDIAAGLEDVKTLPGDTPTDEEVDAALAEEKAKIRELATACGFDLSDEETLADWIASRKP